jgi:hypothetical protein
VAADTPQSTDNAQQVPHKQHLIAQALLRAWVDPTTGHLSCYDVRYGKSYARTTAQVGYVADFIKGDAAAIAAEQRWTEIENEIPNTLEAVAAGEGAVSDEVAASIKRMIALHWARSETARRVINEQYRPHQPSSKGGGQLRVGQTQRSPWGVAK